MHTHFATPERTPPDDLANEIRVVSKSPVISGLLHSVSGLVAILDENRQIIAINHSFLQMLGVEDPEQALGLRPGEALGCVHAHGEPAGCGTTEFCSTCGAAVAIVASLGQDMPAERLCALSAQRDGKAVDLSLRVKSQPIRVGEHRFLLILLQDVTVEQRRAALERTFFHDVNNLLAALLNVSDLLVEQSESPLAELVSQTATQLNREVAIQRWLSDSGGGSYRPAWHTCKPKQIVAKLQTFFDHHPSARGKRLELSTDLPDTELATDIAALFRVLCNMIINALEATPADGVAKMRVDHEGDSLRFSVWNAGAIPNNVAKRIFQRNFSTKAEAGRGIGTYSMKLLGEEVLGGEVTFTSSEKAGTVFTLLHPIRERVEG